MVVAPVTFLKRWNVKVENQWLSENGTAYRW